MPAFDTNGFLTQLATHLATVTSLAFSGTPRAIWLGQAVEASATDPYSTLIPYGGSIPFVPAPSVQIQCMTIGTTPTAARTRAQLLWAALLDSDGRPKRMVSLGGGYTLLGAFPGLIQMLPSDARQRAEVVFNFTALAGRVS